MRNFILTISTLFLVYNTQSQELEGTEFGVDVTFYASSSQVSGGNFGLGLKYGFEFGDYFIVGPSVRYQRVWTNNTLTGTKGGANVYGGGVFAHARLYNYLFLGTEIEFLRSPYNTSGQLTSTAKSWVGTCLIGGGFSREFNEKIRLNAGIYYDILDIPNPSNPNNVNPNSPLRPYLVKNANGTIVPILYRISFFFPLT